MIYLSNKNSKYSYKNHNDVLSNIRSLLQVYKNVEVRDVRISSYFIEIDMSIYGYDEDVFQKETLPKIDVVGPLLYVDEIKETDAHLPDEQAINNAIFLFNMERFWKSHEILEGIWKKSSGLDKSILNGIILIDAAFVHYQKNELDIFISILNRSLEKFKGASEKFFNVDMVSLLENLNQMIEKKQAHFFKIKLE